jgi:protein-S-isoprenylcysteine O-methyltransferase Ste14
MAIHGSLTLGYAVALAVFLDVKSRREERWLSARYPEYAGYRTRVPKLIPFVY